MSISSELARAAAEVAEARDQVPAPYRPWLAGFDRMKAEAEAAMAAGRQKRALELIDAWREDYLSAIASALVNAPLEDDT